MEISRKWRFSCLLLGLLFLATTLQGVQGEVESEGPSESECRPYIEKALKELETAESEHIDPGAPVDGGSKEDEEPIAEGTTDDSEHDTSAGEDDTERTTEAQQEEQPVEDEQTEPSQEEGAEEQADQAAESVELAEDTESIEIPVESAEAPAESAEAPIESAEAPAEAESLEATETPVEEESAEVPCDAESAEAESAETPAEAPESAELQADAPAESAEEQAESVEAPAESAEAPAEAESAEAPAETESAEAPADAESAEAPAEAESAEAPSEAESVEAPAESAEAPAEPESAEAPAEAESVEAPAEAESTEAPAEAESAEAPAETESLEAPAETASEESAEAPAEAESVEAQAELDEGEAESQEAPAEEEAGTSDEAVPAESAEAPASEEDQAQPLEAAKDEDDGSVEEAKIVKRSIDDAQAEEVESVEAKEEPSAEAAQSEEGTEAAQSEEVAETAVSEEAVQSDEGEASKEAEPEDELINEIDVPENLRPRDQIDQLLKLDDSQSQSESILNRISEVTLRELKRLYEGAIKPLETLYKYRDLSNRHFGDSEIFSKPLVVFMGPWSGGKSSIINYLLNNEYNATSLRTGAEPSPAYFNLLMHGDEPEVLDGTQLAADFTFAGLQKFGQGLEERLRGLKLPSKLLEKINIVEIPGILEVRKQVSRVFPFNDACQWFIDRADIIFLVYDPSKLDVGPETEAILDQLKGREHQTRIILNKADQVKPEELMRVQGALIWNISPLMSSAQPPVMYTTTLWSRPYEAWAPVRLLQAQERAFLRDLRSAVDKRIENKISSARRFAVRVRNHAKMVDCYLTTYYNHKSVFGNRKQVSDQIIEHPQDYHIYEGLSTLTNISRYDLPDPDVYRDFFRLNPLYDFQQLSSTCTYFRGCPINRLDVAIAYDLPEMVGKHRKLVDAALAEIKTES